MHARLARYAHCRLERALRLRAEWNARCGLAANFQYRPLLAYSFPGLLPPHAELQPKVRPKSMRGANYRAHLAEWRRGEFSYHVHLLPVHY